MKINEAVKIINGTTTVKAMYSESSMFICAKKFSFSNHSFLLLHSDARKWGNVNIISSNMDGISPQDLGRVMDVIQRLLDTNVKKYKVYRLIANPDYIEKQRGTYDTKYVEMIKDSMTSFSFVYGKPTTFSEKDLKDIEERYPNIAPAIEAMKEPVEE